MSIRRRALSQHGHTGGAGVPDFYTADDLAEFATSILQHIALPW